MGRDHSRLGRVAACSRGSEAENAPDRCGDVWRLEREIVAEKFTFRVHPGLTLVRGPA
jgi:hypothetical protein